LTGLAWILFLHGTRLWQALQKLGGSLWVLGHQGPLGAYYDEQAFIAIVRLVDKLLTLAPDFRPQLWETGIFQNLLCGSIESDGKGVLREEVADFFRKYHMLEDKKPGYPRETSWLPRPSWLEPYFPPQLIRLLQDTKPDVFVRLFNGDLEGPDIIWSTQFRKVCLDTVNIQVRESVNYLFEHPLEAPPPLQCTHEGQPDLYPELSAKSQVSVKIFQKSAMNADFQTDTIVFPPR